MARDWQPESWRSRPAKQLPTYADEEALAEAERRLATFPPLVFAGEARELKEPLADVARRPGFLLQGGDCAESFEEFTRRQHPRHLPPDPADGGGADLRRRQAGGEGRPHGRPVRQAALGADRDASTASSCRPTAATSSTASSSTPAARTPDPRPADPGLLASRPRRSTCCAPSPGRLRRPRQRPPLDAGLRRRAARRASATGHGRPDQRGARLHARLRRRPRARPADHARPTSSPATRRCCSAYEQAMTRVDSTSGDWYDTSRPPGLDRRAHPPARRRARRVLPRHREPDRREVRPDAGAGRPAAPDRRAQSRTTSPAGSR